MPSLASTSPHNSISPKGTSRSLDIALRGSAAERGSRGPAGFLEGHPGERLPRVAKDNVHSLEVQRRNAEANYQQGVAARNDVLKADVALSHAKLQERTASKQLVIYFANLSRLLDLERLQEMTEAIQTGLGLC